MIENSLELEMIKTVHLIKRQIDEEMSRKLAESITVPQAHLICFIFNESINKDIFQKDIEKAFALHRSSVSLMLDKMENSEFIKRIPVENDARLKKIELTPKALAHYKEIMVCIEHSRTKIMQDVTAEEQELCKSVLKKIQLNITSIIKNGEFYDK